MPTDGRGNRNGGTRSKNSIFPFRETKAFAARGLFAESDFSCMKLLPLFAEVPFRECVTLVAILALLWWVFTASEKVSPTVPDEQCISCGQPFPEDVQVCPKCGWSFTHTTLKPNELTFPPRRGPLPKCRIRPYRESDYDVCVELYRLNEPGRFPEGYLDEFCKDLKSGSTLFLVCESETEICGMAGISTYQHEGQSIASFSYGLIHPKHHGRGFGTVMLIARFAVLPIGSPLWLGTMTVLKSSASFYSQFGFVGGRLPNVSGDEMWDYFVTAQPTDLKKCREMLDSAEAILDTEGAVIPTSRPSLQIGNNAGERRTGK